MRLPLRRGWEMGVSAGLLVGCQWIDEDKGRLDSDRDGYHVSVDCNDRDARYSYLSGAHGDLACGDVLEADNHQGVDALTHANCLHPFQSEDLVRAGYLEQFYRFVSDVPVDVVMTLRTDEMLISPFDGDTGGVALLAWEGRECALDTCEVGVPLMPGDWRDGAGVPTDESERSAGWEPSLAFHADAGAAWFVVVTGGQPGAEELASPYTLDVRCP